MLLLTDRLGEAQGLQRTLRRLQRCDIAALHHGATPTTGHSLIVCDVALHLPESIDTLRNALARYRRESGTRVLVLLRDPSHVTEGQARLAGATATLAHPVPAGRLLAAVAALIEAETGAMEAVGNEALKTSVNEAGRILTGLFQHGAGRQPLCLDSLDQGAVILLRSIQQAKIQAWLDIVWRHDDATYQHCLLVAGLVAAFAIELGFPPKGQHIASQAALVHDIGKSQVPLAILNKPSRLIAAETALMRHHAVAGHRMLVDQPGLDPNLLDVVRHHHEHLDGSGYPDGLRGTQISRLVRIVTVCDIYAALIERRPYKPPLAPQVALDHLDSLGPKLDQALVKAFRNVMRDS